MGLLVRLARAAAAAVAARVVPSRTTLVVPSAAKKQVTVCHMKQAIEIYNYRTYVCFLAKFLESASRITIEKMAFLVQFMYCKSISKIQFLNH